MGNVHVLDPTTGQPTSSNGEVPLATNTQQPEAIPMEKADKVDKGKQLIKSLEKQSQVQAIIVMERMLRHNIFSALSIDIELTTNNVVKATSSIKKNPHDIRIMEC